MPSKAAIFGWCFASCSVTYTQTNINDLYSNIEKKMKSPYINTRYRIHNRHIRNPAYKRARTVQNHIDYRRLIFRAPHKAIRAHPERSVLVHQDMPERVEADRGEQYGGEFGEPRLHDAVRGFSNVASDAAEGEADVAWGGGVSCEGGVSVGFLLGGDVDCGGADDDYTC